MAHPLEPQWWCSPDSSFGYKGKIILKGEVKGFLFLGWSVTVIKTCLVLFSVSINPDVVDASTVSSMELEVEKGVPTKAAMNGGVHRTITRKSITPNNNPCLNFNLQIRDKLQ